MFYKIENRHELHQNNGEIEMDNDVDIFKCETCNFSFNSEITYRKHLESLKHYEGLNCERYYKNIHYNVLITI